MLLLGQGRPAAEVGSQASPRGNYRKRRRRRSGDKPGFCGAERGGAISPGAAAVAARGRAHARRGGESRQLAALARCDAGPPGLCRRRVRRRGDARNRLARPLAWIEHRDDVDLTDVFSSAPMCRPRFSSTASTSGRSTSAPSSRGARSGSTIRRRSSRRRSMASRSSARGSRRSSGSARRRLSIAIAPTRSTSSFARSGGSPRPTRHERSADLTSSRQQSTACNGGPSPTLASTCCGRSSRGWRRRRRSANRS